MRDFLTPQQRSVRMASVRQKNTSPEIILRKVLHRKGLRFRLHVKELPGTPDIVLPKYKTVVFVHGCFWHRHKNCRLATTPVGNAQFWIEKFNNNVRRDASKENLLKELGWRVIVIWQCEVASLTKAEETGARLSQEIQSKL